ncbi:MAG: putative capsular polysaccharide synthesis family protein [Candidatus Hodarchaeota archaeon]
MVLFLRKKLEKGINPKKWKIITAVREPVARNISAFFQNQVQYKHMGKMTLKNLLDLFLAENWNYNVLNWFDRELKQVFGIDVYSEPFPTTKGYKIYKVKDQPDLLLLRLENLDNCAQAAFQEFLNIEQFTLAPENIARNKFYYPIYRKFTTSKILPRAYIEKMYTSRLAKHFYTEDELNTFRKKWLKEPN